MNAQRVAGMLRAAVGLPVQPRPQIATSIEVGDMNVFKVAICTAQPDMMFRVMTRNDPTFCGLPIRTNPLLAPNCAVVMAGDQIAAMINLNPVDRPA